MYLHSPGCRIHWPTSCGWKVGLAPLKTGTTCDGRSHSYRSPCRVSGEMNIMTVQRTGTPPCAWLPRASLSCRSANLPAPARRPSSGSHLCLALPLPVWPLSGPLGSSTETVHREDLQLLCVPPPLRRQRPPLPVSGLLARLPPRPQVRLQQVRVPRSVPTCSPRSLLEKGSPASLGGGAQGFRTSP